jgi:hypothetical protein
LKKEPNNFYERELALPGKVGAETSKGYMLLFSPKTCLAVSKGHCKSRHERGLTRLGLA